MNFLHLTNFIQEQKYVPMEIDYQEEEKEEKELKEEKEENIHLIDALSLPAKNMLNLKVFLPKDQRCSGCNQIMVSTSSTHLIFKPPSTLKEVLKTWISNIKREIQEDEKTSLVFPIYPDHYIISKEEKEFSFSSFFSNNNNNIKTQGLNTEIKEVAEFVNKWVRYFHFLIKCNTIIVAVCNECFQRS